ncbi:MAG TPA: hypothetical protein VGC42_28540 [Kofleriaceae bacterium]
MAYRDDAGDACEAPTAQGVMRAELAPRHVKLAVAHRSLEIVNDFVTLVEHGKQRAAKDRRTSIRIAGRLVVARDVPKDGLGVWIELEPGGPRAGFRRIFGVEPRSTLEPAGLAALAALDRVALRLKLELAPLAGEVLRAIELGSNATGGIDKLLVLEHAAHTEVYVRRLFRDRARRAITADDDGRVSVDGHAAFAVQSRHGVNAYGDGLRFTDPHGADLGQIAFPWIAPEDRVELARRLGALVDHGHRNLTAWPPLLPEPA